LKKTGLASQETEETLAAVRKKIRGLRLTREDVIREVRAVRKDRAKAAGRGRELKNPSHA
jgi:hypothetical protein